jgi:hypothetical protein
MAYTRTLLRTNLINHPLATTQHCNAPRPTPATHAPVESSTTSTTMTSTTVQRRGSSCDGHASSSSERLLIKVNEAMFDAYTQYHALFPLQAAAYLFMSSTLPSLTLPFPLVSLSSSTNLSSILPPFNPPSESVRKAISNINTGQSWKDALTSIRTSVESDIIRSSNSSSSSTITFTSPLLYYVDSTIIVLHDMYPKSNGGHLLFMVRSSWELGRRTSAGERDVVNGLTSIRMIDDLEGITLFHEKVEIIKDHVLQSQSSPSSSSSKSGGHVLGYHVIPSLNPLHLHLLLSSTPTGKCVKNKKHINSFIPPFVVTPL